eukprot:1278321-Pyramimonas_sp.AAC.1
METSYFSAAPVAQQRRRRDQRRDDEQRLRRITCQSTLQSSYNRVPTFSVVQGSPRITRPWGETQHYPAHSTTEET